MARRAAGDQAIEIGNGQSEDVLARFPSRETVRMTSSHRALKPVIALETPIAFMNQLYGWLRKF
jgi:hypothetical protein